MFPAMHFWACLSSETLIFDVLQTCTAAGFRLFLVLSLLLEFGSRGTFIECTWVNSLTTVSWCTQQNIPPTSSVGRLWKALLSWLLKPVIELVGRSIATAFGVGQSCPRHPWMAFVHMLVVAVFVWVAGVEPMLWAVEFNLVPFLPLGVFLHVLLVRIVEAWVSGVCSSGHGAAGHFEGLNPC